jgi:hypothetical protein
VIMAVPVSVCHQVSTIGQRPSPTTCGRPQRRRRERGGAPQRAAAAARWPTQLVCLCVCVCVCVCWRCMRAHTSSQPQCVGRCAQLPPMPPAPTHARACAVAHARPGAPGGTTPRRAG